MSEDRYSRVRRSDSQMTSAQDSKSSRIGIRQHPVWIGLVSFTAIYIFGFLFPDVSTLLHLRSLDRSGVSATAYVINARAIPGSRGAWRGDARLARHEEGPIAWRDIRLAEDKWRERSIGRDPVEVVLRYIPTRTDVAPVVDDELADMLKSARVSLILTLFWGGLLVGGAVLGAVVNMRQARRR